MENQFKEGGKTSEAQKTCTLIFLENGEGKVALELDDNFHYQWQVTVILGELTDENLQGHSVKVNVVPLPCFTLQGTYKIEITKQHPEYYKSRSKYYGNASQHRHLTDWRRTSVRLESRDGTGEGKSVPGKGNRSMKIWRQQSIWDSRACFSNCRSRPIIAL